MNVFGQIFKVSIYGESHGQSVGIIIDGCPAGIVICENDFLSDLSKRKGGYKGTTPRIENDFPIFISGLYNNKTTGAPLHIQFENKNIDSKHYLTNRYYPRPGHADYTSYVKYDGFNDPRGSGHFSGRLTTCLVAAGVVAKKILNTVQFSSKIVEIGGMKNYNKIIKSTSLAKDSIGGIVECRISGISEGLGEPFFNSVESHISHIVFSIPAIKGIEFGVGFKASKMSGSQYNDIIISGGKTNTNNSGGINGGITNGNEIIFRVVVKPTSSIGIPQKTIHILNNKEKIIVTKGRHDTCIALRMPVILESAAAIAITDLFLIHHAYKNII